MNRGPRSPANDQATQWVFIRLRREKGDDRPVGHWRTSNALDTLGMSVKS